MAESDDEVVGVRPARRQRAPPVALEVVEPAEAVAEPRPRRRRGAPAEVEAAEAAEANSVEAEPDEAKEAEAEEPSGARRSARRPARSPAARRRNLRESRRILAESGINAENAREGQAAEGGDQAQEDQEGQEGQEGQAAQEGEGGEMGPLGMIGAVLKSTVNYLKTDPRKSAFENYKTEEPYPSLTQLYETAKENPNSPEILRQVTSDFRTLKQGYHDSGCDTDVNISLNPKCIGVQAGLYMRLFDIRKSINESLEQMRPIQQPAVLARIDREARPEFGNEDVFVPAGV